MGREGGSDKSMKTKRVDDIRVYFDTKLMVPKCTSTGLAYIVQFDIQPLKVSLWMDLDVTFSVHMSLYNQAYHSRDTLVFCLLNGKWLYIDSTFPIYPTVCALAELEEAALWFPGLPVV